jgi:hypothetical protein
MLNRDIQGADMDPPHHMMLKGDLQAPLEMYIHKKKHQRYIMQPYQEPVESYRLQLIPLPLARAIHFIFKH